MGQPVWDNEANQWLNDLMDVLDDSLEDTLDVHDLLEDMPFPEDWDQLIEDVLDQFDLDLL